MAVLPVKSPCTLIIIAIVAPLVLLMVAGHCGCCKIFGIWNKMLFSNPLWKLTCVLLGWVPTRAVSLWPAVFLDIAIFTTIVTSPILSGRWPSSRATNTSTLAALEINLIQSFVDILINGHSVCLWKWRLVLRLFFYGIRLLPLWIHKIVVFLCNLVYKGFVCY